MPDQLESQRGHTSRDIALSNQAFDDLKSERTLAEGSLQSAAERLVKAWEDQDPLMSARKARWKANRLRRIGVTGVRITKSRDQAIYKVWAPPGAQITIPTLNKASRLARRLKSNMFVDPPIPEATSTRDDDKARDQAELTTRALIDIGSETGLNDGLKAMQAFDVGSDYGSGFRRFWVDPFGGGWQPVAVHASQEAERVRIQDGVPMAEDGVRNPETGQAYSPPFVERWVTEDGTLVDERNAEGVKRQWIPKIRDEILTGNHVRFLPPTSPDIWEAEGVMIASIATLGQLKDMFPEIERLGKEERKKLLGTVIEKESRDLLPRGMRQGDLVHAAQTKDEQPIRIITAYYRQSPRHPEGLYLIAAGTGVGLHRENWLDPNTGDPLDIPLTQFRQLDDHGDPYGRGMMDELGPGNEVRAAAWGALLEHLDKFNRRRIFLPLNSALHPKELQAPTANALYINPGGAPVYEDLPQFPEAAREMLAVVSAEMDDESGMQQSGQGLNPPGVQSGLHAQTILEQVNAGLSDIRQNTIRGLTRGWRIEVQLAKSAFTIPQVINYVGVDGAFKQREWLGTDLGTTENVQLHRGSFTMLSPSAKAALAQSLHEIMPNVFTEFDLARIVIGNVGPLVGLQDDPQWLRIRRQIERWKQGPSEESLRREPLVFAVGRLLGGQETSPVTLEAQEIFEPVASDEEPNIARVRAMEFARLLASSIYLTFPQSWRQPVQQEYVRMRQAAGIQTMAELAQSQQAAQRAEQQAEQQTEAAKTQRELTKEQMKGESARETAEIRARPDTRINLSADLDKIAEGEEERLLGREP